MEQGKVAARNVAHLWRGEPLEPYSYRSKGMLVSLGMNYAVVNVAGIEVSGYFAWLFWNAVHLYKLVGLKKQIQVAGDWLIGLIFPRDSAIVRTPLRCKFCEHRDVPPLDYALVYRVKQERPALTILVNGGIESLDQAEEHLRHVDGVMLGRAAYQNPMLLTDVDARFFGGAPVDLDAAVEEYAGHVERQLRQGARLHSLIKPMLGLYNGRPGARLFRRHLSEHAVRDGAGIAVLREALSFVRERRAA